MLATKDPTNQDLVIQRLLIQPAMTTKEIYEDLRREKEISIQAVHKITRKLLDQEVLTKNGDNLFVSQEWLLRLQKILPSQAAFELDEGESVRWIFNDLYHMDAFWKHLVFQILQDHPEEPVFMSAPHAIWAYAPERQKSDSDFYQYFKDAKRHVYYAVGGKTTQDMLFCRKMKHEYIHSENTTVPGRLLSHIIVVGDTITTNKLRKKDEEVIERIYQKYGSARHFEEKVTNFLMKVSRVSFFVEHNKEKAQMLRKKIAKDMYVPKETIEKFELW